MTDATETLQERPHADDLRERVATLEARLTALKAAPMLAPRWEDAPPWARYVGGVLGSEWHWAFFEGAEVGDRYLSWSDRLEGTVRALASVTNWPADDLDYWAPRPSTLTAVPAGYQLVPCQPTPEMRSAGRAAYMAMTRTQVIQPGTSMELAALCGHEQDPIYHAMLGAAPGAEAAAPASDVHHEHLLAAVGRIEQEVAALRSIVREGRV